MPRKKTPEKPKKKMGRPTKKTPDAVQKVLVAIKNGLHRDSACAVSGVARRTFYDWLSIDADFAQKVSDAEEFRLGVVEKAKNKLIQEGHRPAIEKELKSKRRDIYGDKQEIDQKTTMTVEVTNEQQQAIQSLIDEET